MKLSASILAGAVVLPGVSAWGGKSKSKSSNLHTASKCRH